MNNLKQYMNRYPFLYVLGGGVLAGVGGGLLFAGYKFNESVLERRSVRQNKKSEILSRILYGTEKEKNNLKKTNLFTFSSVENEIFDWNNPKFYQNTNFE